MNHEDLCLVYRGFKQISKAFWIASTARIVWVQAALRVCLELGMFLPSFPLDEMDVGELEYVAISPARFTKLLRCSPRNRDLTSAYEATLRMGSAEVTEHCLAPGGRYLLTVSGDVHFVLWDLGYMPKAPMPQRRAYMIWQKISHLHPPQPTEDGHSLRFVVLLEEPRMPDM